MLYLNILLLVAIVCFIVDISGIVASLKSVLAKKIKKPAEFIVLKPFDCSLCMSFWAGLIYILVIHQFTIVNFAYICLLSMISSKITDILHLFTDTLEFLINKFSKLL